MTNLRNPESTMMNAHADLQAVLFSKAEGLGRKDAGVGCPDFWYKEETACDRDVKTFPGPTQHKLAYTRFTTVQDIKYLHDMYCRIIPAFGILWNEAVENYIRPMTPTQKWDFGWREQRKGFACIEQWHEMWKKFRASFRRGDPGMLVDRVATEAEMAMGRQGIEPGAHRYRSMEVGKVHFEAAEREGGSWVLSRPPLPRMVGGRVLVERPDFGRIKSIYVHVGPDGERRVITRMKWYQRSVDVYHPTLRCPLVSTTEDKNTRDVMWCAKDIVPWTCLAMPDLKVKGRQVMLARSWCVLRHLGFPQQEHTYPYTELPPVVPDVEDPEPATDADAVADAAAPVEAAVAPVEAEIEEAVDTDDYDRENEGYVAGGESEPEYNGVDSDDPID